MKLFFRTLVAACLAYLAKRVVRKYHPTVVMVTGSVGKTTTKDAVAAALSEKFYVRGSEKSYNTEFGVPLTILGVQNPWTNPLAWFGVFKEALALVFLPNHYPNLLVLEAGADRPGDLEKILRIVTPDVVLVTRLPDVPVHVEAYATPEELREEEFAPAYALPPGAPLIISADDEHALRMSNRLPVRTLTYGMSEHAHVRLASFEFFKEEGRVVGMTAHVQAGEAEGQFSMHGIAGSKQLLAGVGGLAAALALDVSFTDALTALSSYTPPPGRMRVFRGVHNSTVIDDSYNASPVADAAALLTLRAFPEAKRTIAVLGDMLELGRYSVSEHVRIGEDAAQSADVVVAVGIRARGMKEAAESAGKPADSVFYFDTAHAAASALPALIQEGDVILVKGSQSLRMERVVEALLADPLADAKHLVRQDKEWRRRK